MVKRELHAVGLSASRSRLNRSASAHGASWLGRSVVAPCWSQSPIATLGVRRTAGTVCTISFADIRGEVRSAVGRRARLRGGGTIDIFHSGVLARMLGCRVQTVFGWEQRYGFPRPWWNVVRPTGEPLTSRWYSRRQLATIAMLHRAFGSLRGPYRERVAEFTVAVSLIFEEVDRIPVSELRKLVSAALVLGREDVG
jgi:hypothetical protein